MIYFNLKFDYIGDLSDDQLSYKNYFGSGCHPNLSGVSTVVVASIEDKLREHLDRACLGTPLVASMTIPVIINKLTENQGCIVEGPIEKAFDPVVLNVVKMIREVDKHFSEVQKRSSLDPKRLSLNFSDNKERKSICMPESPASTSKRKLSILSSESFKSTEFSKPKNDATNDDVLVPTVPLKEFKTGEKALFNEIKDNDGAVAYDNIYEEDKELLLSGEVDLTSRKSLLQSKSSHL